MNETTKDKQRIFLNAAQERDVWLLLAQHLKEQSDGFWAYTEGFSDAKIAELVSTPEQPATPAHISRRREAVKQFLRPKETVVPVPERLDAHEKRIDLQEELYGKLTERIDRIEAVLAQLEAEAVSRDDLQAKVDTARELYREILDAKKGVAVSDR